MLHGCERPGLSAPKNFRGRTINLHIWRPPARRQFASCSAAPRFPDHNETQDPDCACRLFDKLAREHCPVVRVSLAYFGPKSGFGWRRLRTPTGPPPPAPAAPPSRHEGTAALPAGAPPSGSTSALPTAITATIPTTTDADLAGRNTAVDTALAACSACPGNPVEPGPCSQTQAQSDVTTGPPSHDLGPLPGFNADPVTLLSVPLSLCLSDDIPGSCPPAHTSPALMAVFAAGGLSWEMPIAAALVWACRLYLNIQIETNAVITSAAEEEEKCPRTPYGCGSLVPARVCEDGGDEEGPTNGRDDRTTRAGSRSGNADGDDGAAGEVAGSRSAVAGSSDRSAQGGGSGFLDVHTFADFWRRYQVLLPTAESLNTLLFFSDEELEQLQDSQLAEEALVWQHEVLRAYDNWIDTPTFRAEVGEVPLREWLQAVGAVESRAFGFRSAEDGRELHAYVPFFCLANYRPGAPTLHLLGATRGSGDPMQPEQGPPRSESRRASQRQELERGVASPPRTGSPLFGAYRQVATADMVDMVAWQEAATATATTTTATKPAAEASDTANEPTGGAIAAFGGLKDPQLQLWPGPNVKQDEVPGQVGDYRQGREVRQGPRRSHQQRQHQQHLEGEQQQLQLLEAQVQGGLEQVFIDYGKKDNRSLVYQYGFVLYGNPYDRLDWDGLNLDAECRMRRDWVYDTAERLAQELAMTTMAAAAEAEVEVGNGRASFIARSTPAAPEAGVEAGAGGGSVRGAVGGEAGSSDPGWGAEVEERAEGHSVDPDPLGGWEVARTRFRSAAASVVAACGWRNLRERRQVTRASERRTLTVLMEWVEGQLRALPTSLDHDLRLLRLLQEPGPAAATASPAAAFAATAVVGVSATALVAAATAARREGDGLGSAVVGATASAAVVAPGAMEGAAESVPRGSSLMDTPCGAVPPEPGGTGGIHVVQGSIAGSDGEGRCGARRHVGALAGGNCTTSVQGSGPEAGTGENDAGGGKSGVAEREAAWGRLREAVGRSAVRHRVALEYRVERKLVAHAVLQLLRKLRETLDDAGA